MDTPIVPRQVRKVFEGRVFTVQVESITLPKGMALDAEVVRHPGSVVIVPVTAADDVILVRQYRHAIGRYTWELPGRQPQTRRGRRRPRRGGSARKKSG